MPQQTRRVQDDAYRPGERDSQSPVGQERVSDREVARRGTRPSGIPEYDKYPINRPGMPHLFAAILIMTEAMGRTGRKAPFCRP